MTDESTGVNTCGRVAVHIGRDLPPGRRPGHVLPRTGSFARGARLVDAIGELGGLRTLR